MLAVLGSEQSADEEDSNTMSVISTPEKTAKGKDRMWKMSQSKHNRGEHHIWILTDSVGADFLSNLSGADVRAQAPRIYSRYEVTVQEAIKDSFQAIHAELQLMLQFESPLPVAIIYHCGKYLIGNKCFNLKEIRDLIHKEMVEACDATEQHDRVLDKRAEIKLIWS